MEVDFAECLSDNWFFSLGPAGFSSNPPSSKIQKKKLKSLKGKDQVSKILILVQFKVEPPNNGHIKDECSEVVPFSDVEMNGQYYRQGVNMQFVHCREVVNYSECPLSEVPLITNTAIFIIFDQVPDLSILLNLEWNQSCQSYLMS